MITDYHIALVRESYGFKTVQTNYIRSIIKSIKNNNEKDLMAIICHIADELDDLLEYFNYSYDLNDQLDDLLILKRMRSGLLIKNINDRYN